MSSHKYSFYLKGAFLSVHSFISIFLALTLTGLLTFGWNRRTTGEPRQRPSEDSLHFQKTVFVTSAGESVDAEMGWLVVPELRSRPHGNTIRLPVIRFKSTADKPGYPIVYLAGGPGASGLESAKANIFPVLMALRARGDVIVFDQRGTGAAEPSLAIPGKFDLPLDSTLDSAAARQQLLNKAREATAEIRRRGIDLSAYNTNENADDVNDLRVALGAQKLIIWGHSYGSHLGLAVLRRHGQFVQRAILGGVNGPDQRWRYPNDLQALVERVDTYIQKTPKLQRQMPGLKQTVAAVLKRLEEKPVTVPVQGQAVVVGKKDLEVLIALQAGDIEFIKRLPLLFGNMKDGNYATIAATVRALKQREFGTAIYFSMHIASGVSRSRADEITRQQSGALFGNAINFPFDDPAFVAAWGVNDLGEEYRSPVKSEVPTLFLSGTLDGRTSVDDAKDVMRGFANGRQVIIEGVAHDFYQLTPQVLETMLNFLDNKSFAERIVVPFDLRGPDERTLVLELRKLILEKGVEAAVKRLREMSAPSSESYLTSYVPGTLGIIIRNDDKMPEAAVAVFKAGLELFPENEFLTERLAETYLTIGEKELAQKYYQACVQLNPLNRVALLKLKQLVSP